MIKIKRLEWDSDFWDVSYYNAEKCSDIKEIKITIDTLSKSSPYVIQSLSNDNDVEYINFLENLGFRFVESKIEFVKNVKENLNYSEYLDKDYIKKVDFEDLIEYENEFYNLFEKVSRFSLFQKKKVNDFYLTWVKKSIEGHLDDNCIGYYNNDCLEGFITYKTLQKTIKIGLVGVFPKYQGRKISQKLLSYINNLAIKNKCNEIYVSTQGKNVKAINAYIKNGFLLNNIKHWHYIIRGI